MPDYAMPSFAPNIHARILCRLHSQLADTFEEMAQHIHEAGQTAETPSDIRYHLEQATRAAMTLRMTLQQIVRHCGSIEAAMR